MKNSVEYPDRVFGINRCREQVLLCGSITLVFGDS